MANKCNQERDSSPSSTQATNSRRDENRILDDSSWTRFADEDYIVFCFRKDGAIHVVKDGKKPKGLSDSVDGVDRSPTRPVNPKLMYEKHVEEVYSSTHDSVLDEDERDIYITNEAESIICSKKGNGKRRIELKAATPPGGGFTGENYIEKAKECEMVSAESSDSYKSSGSSSSFAFPVLSWEELESPAQMPKPDPLQLTKHKARAAHLHCCRF
ncbi:hypothetical protein Acr_26g0002300 [Actinidia rufa]|uniref:Protein BREAKING OF ASYMMETRY IN THE STOMATAL LINEAGE n=1 Tax=Actinidia rufa TaxID=165716 RepID=A0A7J0H1H9_9ERIC|nr:hypothetical protein Acr_26g0002300 [Actinidia rufa]